jgi:hypothetical protein
MAKCIIGNNKLLNRSFFTSSRILNGSYFCGNRNISSENTNIADFINFVMPNNLIPFEDEIFYTDRIWFSFACQKDIDTIYCFDTPSGGLSMFRYYGVTQNLLNSKENEYVSLSQELITLISKYRGKSLVYNIPNDLFENKSIDERKLHRLNHTIIRFDNKRSKVVYNNISSIPKSCIPCIVCGDNDMSYRDNINLFMEWISRKLWKHFNNRHILNEKDILLLNLYYENNQIVFFRFGFPEHNLNMSIDELINKCSSKGVRFT